MVLIFGVDLPLNELLLTLLVITIILFIEITVVTILLVYHLRYAKQLVGQLECTSKRSKAERK